MIFIVFSFFSILNHDNSIISKRNSKKNNHHLYIGMNTICSNMIYPQYNLCRNTFVCKPAFKGGFNAETLTHTNIGSCLDGYIGKVKVRKANGQEGLLNVLKRNMGYDIENYSVTNDKNEVMGEISLGVKKYASYDRFACPADPSHVFVYELRNYSNPTTPYYKRGLEYHKDIGTRLLQIAQRRSDEAQCQGNIKLISKNESKQWYKNVIGMTEEFPTDPNSGLRFNIHNPNAMILPPHAKEPLSRLQGGL